ncbi:Ribonuclease G and E [Halalkaliarchaeum sp. AArc-CO]|uniref:DUF402 domain-containing protein n=1 Tax=unclassified Halalkaliarchaeum TaxID=2678344 RepID=UPI00217D3AF7|nr:MULTISPECIES: DUF402 domain-containing protein [unclassified Halalkaliarchaeum]MDR5674118.1 DUF402 domain-containing protein [Halalkaliarchaeum sp. AArc-GB]UWG50837.1 Ribonuclease G and E [Halalkaliarchaeum sp. AArc-CO]
MSGDGNGSPDGENVNVRIRGIYSTALTQLFLRSGFEVVGVSGPIDRRFDEDFPAAGHEAAVETTDDRQGIGVKGDPEAVTAVRETILDTLSRDTLSWGDPTPRGSVFRGRVTETLGSGAVVDLTIGSGDENNTDTGGPMTTDHLASEGYLPYDNAHEHLSVGDEFRVQVTASSPPWTSRRPELDTTIRAYGGVAVLERGREGTTVDTHDDQAARELAGMTDLLGLEPPEGWGLQWTHAATELEMNALEAGLQRAIERADALEGSLSPGDSNPSDDTGGSEGPTVDTVRPEALASPGAGAWLWFGRESRFGLDDRRRDVTTTMPGHHRIKAGSDEAGAGVDFVEALCDPVDDDEFPFRTVTGQFGPHEDDEIRIEHGKPDGRLITLGTGTVTELESDGTVTVERKMTGRGSYDGLGVAREDGDVAVTKFREGRWWYPTTYRDDSGTPKGTYVNVCTPVEIFPGAIRYVDLHVDVVKHRDGTVERVDDDELDAAEAAGNVPAELAEKARAVATALENAL